MTPNFGRWQWVAAALLLSGAVAGPRRAASDALPPKPVLTIQRLTAPITLDGDLSDPGWKGIHPITTWFETNVGDNVEPQVRNVGLPGVRRPVSSTRRSSSRTRIPAAIRAPLGDHDAVRSPTDYARRDRGQPQRRQDGADVPRESARGVQYDALTSDATGEDNAPDFFWDSAGKITATGWTLEIRMPFSSLRYAQSAQPTWGILLYRNYPRDRRYQFFSARLPRDVNCFICNSSKLDRARIAAARLAPGGGAVRDLGAERHAQPAISAPRSSTDSGALADGSST